VIENGVGGFVSECVRAQQRGPLVDGAPTFDASASAIGVASKSRAAVC